jgi:hypothetical protein
MPMIFIRFVTSGHPFDISDCIHRLNVDLKAIFP